MRRWHGLVVGALVAAGTGADWRVSFVDVAAQAGLTQPSVYGGIDKKRFIIETNGAGVAWIDYDNDGWPDALVLSGTQLQEGSRQERTWPPGEAPSNRLYRNRHDGSFSDVTDAAGLRRTGWASAVCAGDYDNDGWLDLFVTYYGHNVLYRNRGGRFEDVTAAAGLAAPGARWGSGCSFLDYDRDGKLDLFVANYLSLDLQTAQQPGEGVNCLWKGIPVNCGPKGLATDTSLLYHNEGSGRFRDVSEASGVASVKGRYAMTAAGFDADGDGWVDIYVACDSTAAMLLRNNRDGTFADVGVASGAALSEFGNEQAGMGLGVGDLDGDGQLDLVKTHFADDIPALYRNLGRGQFEDVAMAAGLGVQNRFVQWGAGAADLDNDGKPDLFYATGNVYPEIEALLPQYPHRSPKIVFRNLGPCGENCATRKRHRLLMKRFDSKDRDAPAGTRSGPRARAAQDRKFGAARAKPRDFSRADPYQRAERPPRPGPARDTPFGERLRAPVRNGSIALDPDVARVFRDSEAVNEALRLVIRLARTVGGRRAACIQSHRRTVGSALRAAFRRAVAGAVGTLWPG